MRSKFAKAVAVTAIAGGSLMASVGGASAAHYCISNPSGTHQTNGNGNRGGDGWRNSSDPGNPSERGGIQNSPALEDCGTTNPPPARNNP